MAYLGYIACSRYAILAGNPRYRKVNRNEQFAIMRKQKVILVFTPRVALDSKDLNYAQVIFFSPTFGRVF